MELSHDCFSVTWAKLGLAGWWLPKQRWVCCCFNLLQGTSGDPLPRWGTGQCRWVRPRCPADPIQGWPCPCTVCGGVWRAQCLNSLMTVLGRCPCPAPCGPRPPVTSPGRKRWGWRHGAAAKSLPCLQTKRALLLLGTSMASCERA